MLNKAERLGTINYEEIIADYRSRLETKPHENVRLPPIPTQHGGLFNVEDDGDDEAEDDGEEEGSRLPNIHKTSKVLS